MSLESEWDGQLLREVSAKWADRVVFFDQCGSTNDEARKLGLKGADHLSVVLTEIQTSGRGRRGQAWCCPPGEGLACSMIIRPSVDHRLWSRHSLAAGIAVAEALDRFGMTAGLKWPNDVWIGQKKVGGILVEAETDFVIVGLGLNVNVTRFPEDLAHPATSLRLECGEIMRREEVLAFCLERLEIRLAAIGSGFSDLLSSWSERSVLQGKMVQLQVDQKTICGKVRGVAAGGELLLQTEQGLEKILNACEIRVL